MAARYSPILLLMVVNPMLAIVSLQTEYSAHLAQGLLVAYLLAFLTHLVAAILSTVLIRHDRQSGLRHRPLCQHVFQLRFYRYTARAEHLR